MFNVGAKTPKRCVAAGSSSRFRHFVVEAKWVGIHADVKKSYLAKRDYNGHARWPAYVTHVYHR
jgi:hypothetical protein